MEDATPSRTALGVARMRALHQFSPQAGLFRDPYAIAILGEAAPAAQELEQEDERRRRMRLFVTARARFAEDWLAAAVRRGIRQLVVLGAGLDTFSLRNPYAGLSVFEVDHPATQAWKRKCIADSGLAEPPATRFVPVDFERQSLSAGIGCGRFAVDRTELLHLAGRRPLFDEGSDLQHAVLDSRCSWLGGGVRL